MTVPDCTIVPVGYKWCPRCRQVLPHEAFQRCASTRDGCQTACRECRNKAAREHRLANHDTVRERERAAFARNREGNLARIAAWGERNPDRIHAAKARYRETHRDACREYNREYARTHPDVAKRAKARFNARHPERVRSYILLRKARIRGAPVVERFTRAEIYERDNGRCHICGRKVPRSAYHIDHLVPVSRGGEHSRRNVAVACPSCNQHRNVNGPAQLRLGLDEIPEEATS